MQCPRHPQGFVYIDRMDNEKCCLHCGWRENERLFTDEELAQKLPRMDIGRRKQRTSGFYIEGKYVAT